MRAFFQLAPASLLCQWCGFAIAAKVFSLMQKTSGFEAVLCCVSANAIRLFFACTDLMYICLQQTQGNIYGLVHNWIELIANCHYRCIWKVSYFFWFVILTLLAKYILQHILLSYNLCCCNLRAQCNISYCECLSSCKKLICILAWDN